MKGPKEWLENARHVRYHDWNIYDFTWRVQCDRESFLRMSQSKIDLNRNFEGKKLKKRFSVCEVLEF